MQEKFFIVSALVNDWPKSLADRQHYDTESEAVTRAKSVMEQTQNEGRNHITGFYVLEAKLFVGIPKPVTPPMKVTRLKPKRKTKKK